MIQKLFAKIIDKKTGQLIVGTGTNSEFYKSLGMTLMDVEQHKDGNWYIPGSEDDIKYNLLEQLADYQRLLSSTGGEYLHPIFLLVSQHLLISFYSLQSL